MLNTVLFFLLFFVILSLYVINLCNGYWWVLVWQTFLTHFFHLKCIASPFKNSVRLFFFLLTDYISSGPLKARDVIRQRTLTESVNWATAKSVMRHHENVLTDFALAQFWIRALVKPVVWVKKLIACILKLIIACSIFLLL